MGAVVRCICVIGLAVALSAGSPPHGSGRPNAGAQDEIDASLRNIASALQNANKPAEYHKPCDYGGNDRHSELCAQWIAADSATSSANAAWASLYVGTLIGLLTLGAAVGAAYYAREAATHTKAGSDVATDTYKAFVGVERPRLTVAARGAQPLGGRNVKIIISAANIGKSAAYVHGIASGASDKNTWPPPLTKFDRLPRGFVVKGEGECEIGEIQVGIDGNSGYVLGVLVYSSAFASDHHSYFCVHVERVAMPSEYGDPERWEVQSFHKGGKWPEDT